MSNELMIPRQNSKVRIGVIGTGAFAETCHLPGLQSHPSAEVVAICGRRYDHVRSLADRFNIPDVYTDFHELCSRSDLDAVTIVTPNSEHAKQAMAAFESGKHVFCEKPMAINIAEAQEMVLAAERSGKIHQMAFTYRYLYGVQELRRRVLRGDIGTPHYVRAQYDCWDGLQPTYRVGFRDKLALAGGGMLYDVGSHLFDIARFILGPIESATGVSKLIPRQEVERHPGTSADIETDDLATAWFVHESGVRGHWFASRVTPSYAEKAFLEVIGQEGALRASLSRGGIDVLRRSTPAKPEWEELPLPDGAQDHSPHCLALMMRSFVEACLRGKLDEEVDASFSDGLAAQRALAAVAKSSIHPGWVRL